MAREKKDRKGGAKKASKGEAPARARRPAGPPRPWVGWVLRLLVAASLAAMAAVGLDRLRARLLASDPYAGRLADVRLADLPAWMPADIAAGVRASVSAPAAGRSVFEPLLAEKVYAAARANPWVERALRVTKHHDGTVTVSARYRKPFALVRWNDKDPSDLRVVDAEGVVLPLPLHRANHRLLAIIGDVRSSPPAPGEKWDAPDLADGLRLLALLAERPYARQITMIDVRNHARRISPVDPELRMYAQVGAGRTTDIRFGGFGAPDGLDATPSAEARLDYLDQYVQEHGGQLAGIHAYLELRYDRLHVSIR